MVVIRQWPLYQPDVKNTILNGFLQEEIYMTTPLGLALPPHHVCKPNHTLYGLEQAPRA